MAKCWWGDSMRREEEKGRRREGSKE